MKISRLFTIVLLPLLIALSAFAGDWQIIPSPSVGNGSNSLAAVASVSDNDIWAVGWAFNSQLGAYRTLTEHWNGTNWSVVKSRNTTNGRSRRVYWGWWAA